MGGSLLSASLGSASSQGSIGAQNKPRPIVGVEKAMAPHSSTLAWKIPWLMQEVQSFSGNNSFHYFGCLLGFRIQSRSVL